MPKGFDTDVNGAAISEFSIGNHGKGKRFVVLVEKSEDARLRVWYNLVPK